MNMGMWFIFLGIVETHFMFPYKSGILESNDKYFFHIKFGEALSSVTMLQVRNSCVRSGEFLPCNVLLLFEAV